MGKPSVWDKCKWWSRKPNGDIEFFDVQVSNSVKPPDKPSIFHFIPRQYNILKWKECLETNTILPVHTLHGYDLEKREVIIRDVSEEAEYLQNNHVVVSISEDVTETDAFNTDTQESYLNSPHAQVMDKVHVQTPCSQPTTPNTPVGSSQKVTTMTTQNAQTPKRKVRKLTSTANPIPMPPHTPAEQNECKTILGAALTKLFSKNDNKAKHTSKQSQTYIHQNDHHQRY